MKGIRVPTDIKIRENPKVGDIVKLRKRTIYNYKWHIDNPNIHYYGIVKKIFDGRSYCILMLQIIHPYKGKEDYVKKNYAFNDDGDNCWDYGKEDIECICDLDTLSKIIKEKAILCLLY
jgi:hypothetical protein